MTGPLGYRDPFGSPIAIPNPKVKHHPGGPRTGFVQVTGPLPELDTLGMRLIFAPVKGESPMSLFQDGPFVFQCPPLEEFLEQFAYNHADFMTAYAGERSRPQGRQLETIQFDTLWLDDGSRNHAPDWAIVKKAVDPIAAKSRLKALLYSGKPIWMLAHQMPVWHKYDLRMKVTLRSVTSMEKSGELDARYFGIQVREWRDSELQEKKLDGSDAKGGKPHGADARERVLGRVLVATLPAREDSLYGLATEYYGSVTMWRSIAKANGITGVGPSESLKAHFANDRGKMIKLLPRAK